MSTMHLRSHALAFWIALRPFSLSLALGALGTGLLAVWTPAEGKFLLVAAVMVAGLASQAGANLINDFFEGSFKYHQPGTASFRIMGIERTRFDWFVFASGLGSLGLAGLIGLRLVWLHGWPMLIIGLVGILGSYAYTGEPFVYKRHGLGVPLSFVLMGLLMPLGTSLAVSGMLDWWGVVLGLPLSLYIPALMLSNELRDHQRDSRISMGTLSVRLGAGPSTVLFGLLVGLSWILLILYVVLGLYPPGSLVSLVLLPLAWKSWRAVRSRQGLGIPRTNLVQLGVTLIVLASLALDRWL